MSEDVLYAVGGRILGYLTAAVTFIGAWIYCMATYGFLFGFGLGWLPAAILAVIVGVVVRWTWPLLLLAILVIGILVFRK